MATGASGFPIGLALIPLIMLVTVGGLFLLGRFFKTRVDADLKQITVDMRRLEAQRREIYATLAAFEDAQKEPFLSRVNSLRDLLDSVDAQLSDLQNERVRSRERAAGLNVTHWRAMIGAPYLWFALYREGQQLLGGMRLVEQTLQEAGQKEQEIHRLGWSIAQQVRQARQLQRQTRKALEALQARGLCGKAFEMALSDEARNRSVLEAIPEYLYNDSEERVLALLDRETATEAHSAVEAARPAMEGLLEQARAWSRQAGQADEQATRLRRLLEDIEQTLTSLPAAVDSADARVQLGQMEQIARSLEATLKRLEAESIEDVTLEAERQARLAQDLSQLLKRARRESPALQTTLAALPAASKEISAQTTALSKAPRFPVHWGDSSQALAKLDKDITQLGGPERPRPPDQIQKDLEIAAGLRARQTELVGQVQQARQNHEKLLTQIAELDGLDAWMETARGLAEKVGRYAAENWSRQEAVERLAADIDAVGDDARKLEIFKLQARLEEAQLPQRVADATALVGMVRSLRRRVDTVQSTLDALIQQEQQTTEVLEKTRAALGQIEYVVNSNDFLGGVAAQELGRIAGEHKRLSEETADRRRGRVDVRLRQATALAERLEANANRWLEQLVGEIEAQNEDLSALLKELDEIAALDEQPIEDARRLLSSGSALPRSSVAARGPLELEAVISELKRRSDYWHSANAAMRAMEDFHPLIETYQEAVFQREQAHRLLGEAGAGVRQRRAWPPTTVSLDGERDELKKIEAQWQEQQDKRDKAIARTARLGGLAARYSALSERIAQVAERAAHEGNQVDDLEGDINDLALLWQNHLPGLQEYPEAAGEIQGLLEEISREAAQVRRRYQQGGSDYNAVLQALKALKRRVQYFQIALDNDRSMDIQGKVTYTREGKNVRGKYY